MKTEVAENIIDEMYQNKMSQRNVKTDKGTVIDLSIDINFTELEEASVIVLREEQVLKQECKEKQERIDRAIDMLESHAFTESEFVTNVDRALRILKKQGGKKIKQCHWCHVLEIILDQMI